MDSAPIITTTRVARVQRCCGGRIVLSFRGAPHTTTTPATTALAAAGRR